MQQPRLIIIAGCNGSGKSTYSQSLVDDSIKPFDYDFKFAENYNALKDSEFREEFAKNKTTKELENLIQFSFDNGVSFCFETNLMTVPFNWIEQAKKMNFTIDIYFFCLIDIKKAKERVLIRTKNNGHYVEDSVIEYKWKAGYKNINEFYHLADHIAFLDNSDDENIPSYLFELNKKNENEFEIIIHQDIPEYVKRRLPSIFDLIIQGDTNNDIFSI